MSEQKRERPIPFQGAMVRAILSGQKTQTRRIVKGRALEWLDRDGFAPEFVADPDNGLCPYGRPGDRLWVRETWQQVSGNERSRRICDNPRSEFGWTEYAATPRPDEPAYKWRPSIHMPRWASRITLEVTGVRVERLQDISEADALAESVWTAEAARESGVIDRSPGGGVLNHIGAYRRLWEDINGPGSWDLNPWVWVVEFAAIGRAGGG